jgi:hypothetical protein
MAENIKQYSKSNASRLSAEKSLQKKIFPSSCLNSEGIIDVKY